MPRTMGCNLYRTRDFPPNRSLQIEACQPFLRLTTTMIFVFRTSIWFLCGQVTEKHNKNHTEYIIMPNWNFYLLFPWQNRRVSCVAYQDHRRVQRRSLSPKLLLDFILHHAPNSTLKCVFCINWKIGFKSLKIWNNSKFENF